MNAQRNPDKKQLKDMLRSRGMTTLTAFARANGFAPGSVRNVVNRYWGNSDATPQNTMTHAILARLSELSSPTTAKKKHTMPEANVNKKPDMRGQQAELARKLGVTRQCVNEIFTGKRIPGSKMAKRLESVTGVPRAVWMYPDEYPDANPLLKGK